MLAVNKIDLLLKKWILEILPNDCDINDFLEILVDCGECTSDGHEYKASFNIYTNNYKYNIVAIDRQEDDGYLGATCALRKYLTGESWFRGNDLSDGPFTLATWVSILNDIIKNEILKLESRKNEQIDICSSVSN